MVLVQTLRLRWLRGAAGRRLRAFAARGAVGELEAGRLLERAGFVVDGVQVGTTLGLLVDGELVEVVVRADYLVSRRGRRFVAEVKTGRVAPRIDHAPTRRQLLEYRHAFDVDGVLLVDAESGTVMEIEFPSLSPQSSPGFWWWLLGVGMTAVVVAVWLTHR